MRNTCFLLLVLSTRFLLAQDVTITGSVRDKYTGDALPYANVVLLDTPYGTTTDEKGKFTLSLPSPGTSSQLAVSYMGYVKAVQVIRTGQLVYNFNLQPVENQLNEVVVSGTMKEVTKMNSAIPVEVYSPAFFKKNPAPNIFESLSMVNGVQPQLNCNVCNTGDIHINGMEGPYTMVLIDGMPIVSSLSTVYGLAGIPNSMVKRIEVVKGPASTLYGSEAVGGIINIITKNPADVARFAADISATTYQEYNADVTTQWKVKNNSAILGINVFNYWNKADKNNDNITDVTQQRRISIFNKWNLKRKSSKASSLALRYVYENRWGGELNWTNDYRGSDSIYGESILTNRAEVIGIYQLPLNNQNLFFDYSYNYHIQDSYYGIIKYYAEQHVGFAQLRWNKIVNKHDLLIGVPLRITVYDDNTVGTSSDGVNMPMKTILPGIFLQDEITITTRFTTLAGIRYDLHNEHGNIFSPRLSFKYSPNKNNTIRLSGGNGFRVVNLFTEDHAALTGAREVVIKSELKPEQSWNVNLNYVTFINVKNGYAGIDASVFYTYFINKITGDFLTDPTRIIYDNLQGYAVSKGITLNTELTLTNSTKIIMGATYMDVFQVETNPEDESLKIPQLFAPEISGTAALSYEIKSLKLNIDLTANVNGPMYLPVLEGRPERSPWFALMNIQFTKPLKNNFELYTGLKNILNFMPDYPVYGPGEIIHDPFSDNFDPSYNYAPVQGIKGFLGIRFRID
jgi:outer membrane receptor for ferrienterochelin and colicins